MWSKYTVRDGNGGNGTRETRETRETSETKSGAEARPEKRYAERTQRLLLLHTTIDNKPGKPRTSRRKSSILLTILVSSSLHHGK